MFHAFIWLSEKNKTRISGRKKRKENCRALNVEIDLFFHWNKCFCYYTESKVPVQMWTVPNPNHIVSLPACNH